MAIEEIQSKLMQVLQFLAAERLRTFLLCLATLCFLSLLADLFWRVLPEPRNDVDGNLLLLLQSTPKAKKQEAIAVDLEQMQSWHLFGKPERLEEVLHEDKELEKTASDDEALEAKETKLRLKLLGLMRSSIDAESYAVIEANNAADLYQVGQALPVGQNIKLSRVLSDRVIIDNRGNFEALLLYDENERGAGRGSVTVNQSKQQEDNKTIDQRSNRRITAMANSYRQRLLSNPMSLADVISISMARDSSGNILGYSVRPGRDRRQFTELGLRSGDIVTAVNGISLQDPSGAMEIYNHLGGAKEASLSIKRGDEDIVILVGLSE